MKSYYSQLAFQLILVLLKNTLVNRQSVNENTVKIKLLISFQFRLLNLYCVLFIFLAISWLRTTKQDQPLQDPLLLIFLLPTICLIWSTESYSNKRRRCFCVFQTTWMEKYLFFFDIWMKITVFSFLSCQSENWVHLSS